LQALQGLDLLVQQGELVAIVGASGSGKSTLLNILSGLDKPTAGAVRVAGCDLMAMRARARLGYRRRTVGFVWQQTGRNLLPYLSAQENVMLPMSYAGVRRGQRVERAGELLELLGIGYCRERRPAQLSGGEQQRVAVATALANRPAVLFADEPTGELDSATSEQVFDALRGANRELGVTVVIVTHDAAVSARVGRTVEIRDGRISTETVRPAAGGPEGSARGGGAVLRGARPGRARAAAARVSPRRSACASGLLLALEADHIGVWPQHTGGRERRGRRKAPPRETNSDRDSGRRGALVGDRHRRRSPRGRPHGGGARPAAHLRQRRAGRARRERRLLRGAAAGSCASSSGGPAPGRPRC